MPTALFVGRRVCVLQEGLRVSVPSCRRGVGAHGQVSPCAYVSWAGRVYEWTPCGLLARLCQRCGCIRGGACVWFLPGFGLYWFAFWQFLAGVCIIGEKGGDIRLNCEYPPIYSYYYPIYSYSSFYVVQFKGPFFRVSGKLSHPV